MVTMMMMMMMMMMIIVKMMMTLALLQALLRRFTGHDPTCGSGQEIFKISRAGSGKEVFESSRVGAGRGGSVRVTLTRPDSTRPAPTREVLPDP